MRKWTMFGVGLLMAVLFTGTALAQELRVGIIDINKILNESDAGMAAKKKMESRYEELKKKVDAKQEEARALKEELDKQKVMLGKEKVKEKEDALQAKVNELRQLTQEGEKEMQGRQGEFTRDVLKRIEVQVDALVKAENLDLVLERSAGVVYFRESMDITQRVLDMVNKGGKESGAKKGAGAKKEGGGGK
jgi:outer membrane protein